MTEGMSQTEALKKVGMSPVTLRKHTEHTHKIHQQAGQRLSAAARAAGTTEHVTTGAIIDALSCQVLAHQAMVKKLGAAIQALRS